VIAHNVYATLNAMI